jgi:Resolvase, N terminal domain
VKRIELDSLTEMKTIPGRVGQLYSMGRPANDAQRKFDVVACRRLDRLGRNLKHSSTLLEELQALGIAFVSLAAGIDATTAAGKLQMHSAPVANGGSVGARCVAIDVEAPAPGPEILQVVA